jgi:hypothetical protein
MPENTISKYSHPEETSTMSEKGRKIIRASAEMWNNRRSLKENISPSPFVKLLSG